MLECISKIQYLAGQWEFLSPNCSGQQFPVLQKRAPLAILNHLQKASEGCSLGLNAVVDPATRYSVNDASHQRKPEQYVFLATFQIVRGFLFETEILRSLKNKPKCLWQVLHLESTFCPIPGLSLPTLFQLDQTCCKPHPGLWSSSFDS